MSSIKFHDPDSMKRATSAFINALKIPQLSSVRFEDVPLSTAIKETKEYHASKSFLSLKSTWSQSSVASGSKINFSRTDVCVLQDGTNKYKSISGNTLPIANDPESFISDFCPERQLEVRIRKILKDKKDEPNFVLDIWNPNQLLRSINLTEIDAHGEVYLDGELGGLAINRQGTKLAYIAEEKRPKNTPFFKGYGATLVGSKKGTHCIFNKSDLL